jgi:2-methylcitrate dehydratase PrpD
MKVTRILVKNIIKVAYETLSPAVIEMTKKLILDSLACALAGSSAVGMRELNELMNELGGKEESTVVAYGSQVPSPSAALVNGSMGRALDFDDTHDVAIIHPAVPVVSAGFAVAERRETVSGREFIPAITLGIDLSCRMSAASPVNMLEGYGWDYSAMYGYFGAAATSSKILGFGEDELLNALGIAYYQSSGMRSSATTGYTTKAMGSGFAARGGVISALMAEKGITGTKEPLEGKWGVYNLFHRGDYIPQKLTGGLGETFMVEDDSFKPYPCCRCIHPFIDATVALVKENDLKPLDVEEVIAYAGHASYFVVAEPLEFKQSPPTSVASQFSLPWALANAINYRKVEIKHFTDEAVKSKDIKQLAKKIVPRLDPKLSREGIEPAIVEIKMKGGETYSKRVEHALGHPENPLGMEGIAEKFRTCATYAARPISEGNLAEAVGMVEDLENVADVGQIPRLLG